MFDFYHQNKISKEMIVEKMCHNPAILFNVKERGYIREGYFADLVLVDLNNSWKVSSDNILYKCKWSPFENNLFQSKIIKTIVNGNLVYDNGIFNETKKGERLKFEKVR
jgi:dihydroorotase